jgi:hypothetical protein
VTKTRESYSTRTTEEIREYHQEITIHAEYYGKFDKALKELNCVKLPVDPGQHFFTWREINEKSKWPEQYKHMSNEFGVKQLIEWCEENSIEGEYNDAGVLFYREEDAVKFKLQCIIEG